MHYARDFSILASGFKTKEEAEAWRENYIKENPDSPLVKDADHIIVDETAILGQAGPTTDEQTQIAKEGGYDGNIQYNIVDVGHTEMYEEDGVFRVRVDEEALKPRTNYIAFEPSQIKSADPVTYDDAGNIIPLSERFNPENKDIRYSISSEEDILFEKKTAFLTDLVREYNISLPTFIAQTKEEFVRMVQDNFDLTDDEVEVNRAEIERMGGAYVPEDEIVLINGGVIRGREQMSGCVRHEFGHYITKKHLLNDIRQAAKTLGEDALKRAQQEFLRGYRYKELGAEGVVNELVSYLSETPTIQEIMSIFEENLEVDEFIEGKSCVYCVASFGKEEYRITKETIWIRKRKHHRHSL